MIGIQLPRARLRYVGRLELEYLDDAATAARNLNPDGISRPYGPVRFAAVAIDLDPAALTRGLRLRTCFEDARHVKPDIEPDRVISSHGNKCRGRRPVGQAGFNK